MPETLLNTPGLARQSPAVLRAVWDMSARNGWNPDALIGHIEHESGWKPGIKNPSPDSTASGIAQITEATASALGTSTAALRRMSVLEQLPYVETYFKRHQARHGMGPWDFTVFGLGTGNLEPGPMSDEDVIYPPGSGGALANPSFQDPDGAIRVGTVRRALEQYVAKFTTRPRLKVPPPDAIKPPKSGGMLRDIGVATVSGLAVYLIGRWAWGRIAGA